MAKLETVIIMKYILLKMLKKSVSIYKTIAALKMRSATCSTYFIKESFLFDDI